MSVNISGSKLPIEEFSETFDSEGAVGIWPPEGIKTFDPLDVPGSKIFNTVRMYDRHATVKQIFPKLRIAQIVEIN